MALDLSTKVEVSADLLEKLTNTNLAYPSRIEDLIERIKALKKLSTFLFNGFGYVSQGLTNLTIN